MTAEGRRGMAKSRKLDKWDHRFLALAEHISHWSKDPSTKVGAVITHRSKRVVSMGFNGLPAGVAPRALRRLPAVDLLQKRGRDLGVIGDERF